MEAPGEYFGTSFDISSVTFDAYTLIMNRLNELLGLVGEFKIPFLIQLITREKMKMKKRKSVKCKKMFGCLCTTAL